LVPPSFVNLLYPPIFLCKKCTDLKFLLYIFFGFCLYFGCFFIFANRSTYCIETIPYNLAGDFLSIILGSALAFYQPKISLKPIYDSFYFILSIGAYIGLKIAFKRGVIPLDLQVMQYFAIIFMAYSSFKIANNIKTSTKFFQNSVIITIISFISGHTLEIYMVHVLLLPIFPGFSFPFNLSLFLLFTLLLATIAKIITNHLTSFIKKSI
jgi:hypothetical protein